MPDSPALARFLLAAVLCMAGAERAAAQVIREPASRVDSLRLLARRDTCDPAVAYTLGIALLSRDQYDAADTAFQRAAVIDPQFAQAWLGMGLVQDRNRRYWNALRGDRAALDRERQRRRAWLNKAFLVDPFVDVRLLFAGSDAEAWPVYESLMKDAAARGGSLDSVSPDLLWLHALIGARTSHYREAIGDVEALLRISTAREAGDSLAGVPLRTNEFRYMLAALHQRSGNRREAARWYREVLANDIGNYMAHAQLARMAEADSNWSEALRARRAAIEVNPEDHSLHSDLAITLTRAGQWPAAERALTEALALSTCDADILRQLAIVQRHLARAPR